jgi:nitrate/nitrite-specific signal transduction histidine kinase
MQARAQRLKAKLHFESTLNQGTRLVLTITAPEQ